MDPGLAELIGIIIGDGFLESTPGHYRMGIVGDPIGDREYYHYVKRLIKEVWGKDVKIVHRQRGLRITFSSKNVFKELSQDYGIPIGEGKSSKVVIPGCILESWDLTKNTIRGLVDTDGSVFTSDKPGSPRYPSIEITTSSIELAGQVRSALIEQGFRVAKIWGYKSKNSAIRSYKIPLNGEKNVAKWLEGIGFSNPTKRRKAEKIVE